ncbi:hypothetical protein U1Q18_052005, partial [Sarracenia purpurea var. burkii]
HRDHIREAKTSRRRRRDVMTSQRKAFTSKENSLRAITFIVLITKGRYDLQRIQRRRQTNRERCGPFVPKFKTTDAAASASTSAPVPGQ